MQTTQPVLFISHGSPDYAIVDTAHGNALGALGKRLRANPPRAIVVVSAHWDTARPAVSTQRHLRQIYDFYGFPPELSRYVYSPPGAPDVAAEALALLAPLGGHEDQSWGLDHGAWTVLCRLFPAADIPTLQVSVDTTAPAEAALRAGEALRPLRERGVLIVCSGSLTHNLGELDWDGSPYEAVPAAKATKWAREFDEAASAAVTAGRSAAWKALANWESGLPHALRAHPTADHMLPLLFAVGAMSGGGKATEVASGFVMGTMSMRSWLFD